MKRDGQQPHQIIVVLRYDDFEAGSDTELERRIIELLRKNGLCAVFGVVPFGCESGGSNSEISLSAYSDKTELLRQAVTDGTVEAALHGYCHEFRRLPKGGNTEFAGRGVIEQLKLVRSGMQEVELCSGKRPICFIPPFNSYDLDTVKALEQAGILCLSASMFGVASVGHEIRFFPQTCSLMQTRLAVESARQGRENCPLIMPLFHQYDFMENDPVRGKWRLEQFEEMLAWLVSQPDVVVRTVSRILEEGHDLSPGRYLAHQKFLRASLHPWSAPCPHAVPARLRLQDDKEATRMLRVITLRTVMAYSLVALVGLLAGMGCVVLGLPQAYMGAFAAAGNIVLLVVLLRRKSRMYYNSIRLSFFMVMLLVGVWSL